ncbi:MAG TPA: HAMP domain-containing sensor histidine kinase [Allosphingosinicella sp.]|jgi:signal transduction histidine kinase|nr:HAMP domain-containing sensor histidine kinase [Allosphingosinicella sp.]
MRLPTTLRVGLLAALLAFLSSAALIGFIHWRTYDDSVDAVHQQVVEQASALDDVYSSGGRRALDKAMADTLAAGDPQLLVAIFAANGAPRIGNVGALLNPPVKLRSGYRVGRVRRRDTAATTGAAYLLRHLDDGEWLLTGRSLGERLQFQRILEGSLGLALAISVLLGLLCGLIIARYVGSRVADMADVADRIAGGDLAQRVPLSGSRDSFDGLAQQINRMLDRMAALMEELRLLTDSLAHDLRSPVGRLRARVEAALAAEDEKRRDVLLAGVLQEADSLMRILTTVLEIGRSEAMASRKQFAPLDPEGLIDELAEMYEPIAEEAGCALTVEAESGLPIFTGHRQLVAQTLSNLLDNALHYARQGREVVLFARVRDGRLRLGVADRGPGIAPADQAEARRRFGRLDSSRSTGGAGLGLALAEAVAHLHGGELELVDNAPGLRAVLVLPLAPPSPTVAVRA